MSINRFHSDSTYQLNINNTTFSGAVLSATAFPYVTSENTGYVLRVGTASGDDTGFTPYLMVKAANGNVGIGTTSPLNQFVVQTSANSYGGDSLQVAYDTSLGTGGGVRLMNYYTVSSTELAAIKIYSITTTTGAIGFFTNAGSGQTERMRILANGNVGIGNTTPPVKLWVPATSTTTGIGVYNSDVALIIGNAAGGTNAGSIQVNAGGSSSAIGATSYTLALNPDGGNVGIGTTSPSQKLHISGGDPHTLYGPSASYNMNLAVGSGNPPISSTTATVTCSNGNLHIDSAATGAAGRGLYLNFYTSGQSAGGSGSAILSYGPWTHTGNFTVTGGTKSFRIPHPVVPNKDLIHSCVEGPRNDLMYRGTVTLVNGTATVDMNKNSTTTPDCAMTDGTFEALCTNPQFFLQNMSGFDRVRGTMSGANLVIISENQTSTDVISCMVVAERHDAAMISTDLTNDAGYLVTEQESLPPNPYSTPPPS